MRGLMGSVMVGLLLMSTGCAEQSYWLKDGHEGLDDRQFKADQFDCKQKSYTMVGGYDTVKNFGTLAVNAPGFFSECMESKGYSLVRESQMKNAVLDWAKRNMLYGERVWAAASPSSILTQSTDYKTCGASLMSEKAKGCMEGRGYRLLYPASMDALSLRKDSASLEQRTKDRIECDAMSLGDVRSCLQEKGYTEGAPVSVQNAMKATR